MSSLSRILEPEVMDTPEEARDYDAMDHSAVNRLFVADFLAAGPVTSAVLDVGTGTAQIPIELCRADPSARVVAVDAAAHMLTLARANIERAGLAGRFSAPESDERCQRWPRDLKPPAHPRAANDDRAGHLRR